MVRTGWFKESARHSLAARGIPTGRASSNKYFAVKDYLKGNREDFRFKRAYAKGWTKEQLRRDPDARAAFGISVDELGRRRLSQLPEAPAEFSSPMVSSAVVEELPFERTVEESVPEEMVSPEVIPDASGAAEAADFSGPEVVASAPLIDSEGVPSEPAEPSTVAPFKKKEPFWWVRK